MSNPNKYELNNPNEEAIRAKHKKSEAIKAAYDDFLKTEQYAEIASREGHTIDELAEAFKVFFKENAEKYIAGSKKPQQTELNTQVIEMLYGKPKAKADPMTVSTNAIIKKQTEKRFKSKANESLSKYANPAPDEMGGQQL